MTITDTSSTVQAIFSLHVVTAGCALLLLVGAALLLAGQLAGGTGRPRRFMKFATGRFGTKTHSSMGTHLFLMSGLFNLMVAYATIAAIVALQTYIDSPFYVTSAYSYPSYVIPTGNRASTSYTKSICVLSFLYQCAMILMNASIVGAIWIHTNHLQTNGTGIKEPGFLSWIWNGFWIFALLALGFASWALGLERRGNGDALLAYPSLIAYDYSIRTLFVTYVVIVIFASTSATVEAFLCWMGVKKNGVTGNKSKSALTRFVMFITPIVWIRNAFYVAQIVIIYYDETSWSRTTNQALAFLFIIFTELCDLGILALVLLGAWSFGRKQHHTPVVEKNRYTDGGREYMDGPVDGTT